MRPVVLVYTPVLRLARPAWLLAGLALMLPVLAPAADAESAWYVEKATHRMAFPAPSQSNTMVLARLSLPSGVSNDTGIACYDMRGNEAPFRVVSREDRDLWLLISLGEVPDAEYHVYFGAPDIAGRQLEDLANAKPLGVTIFRSGALGIPNSWEKMRYMVGTRPNPVASFRQPRFGVVDWDDPIHYGSHSRSPARAPERLPIVKLDVRFLCPASGHYRFAVDSRDVAYVLVDGALVASRSEEGFNGTWHPGESVHLEAGVHRLEVFHKTNRQPCVNVGWLPPEQDTIQPIPPALLLSSCMVEEYRMDRRADSPRPPDLSFAVRSAYTFRGCPAVFVPVQFTATAPGAGRDVLYEWDFGDGETGTGRKVTHTFKAASLYTVTLSVRSGESPVRTLRSVVDCRVVSTRHYVFDPQVIGLPAVCYAGDAVNPILLIEGMNIPGIPLDVRWTADGEAGPRSGTAPTTQAGESERLPIVSCSAGALSQITWSVSHLDVRICGETVTFLRAPFAELPVAAHGERLYNAKGDRIVLIPFRHASEFSQPRLTLDQAFGQLVCVDDSLAVSGMYGDFYETTYYRRLGALLNGPDRPIIDHVALRGWSEDSEIYGPLLRLLDAPHAAKGADVVVLTVGLPDIEWGNPPAEYERHVAALVDILSATRGCPVVLATPPSYPDTTANVRLYAAAVQRVAQARDIPVADVYSAFMSTGQDSGNLFADRSGFILSGRGHHLAARVMARAILMQTAEDR